MYLNVTSGCNVPLSSPAGCWSPAGSRFRQTLPRCLCSVSNQRSSLLKKSKLLFHWVFWDDAPEFKSPFKTAVFWVVTGHSFSEYEWWVLLLFVISFCVRVPCVDSYLHYPPIITDLHSIMAFSSSSVLQLLLYICVFININIFSTFLSVLKEVIESISWSRDWCYSRKATKNLISLCGAVNWDSSNEVKL